MATPSTTPAMQMHILLAREWKKRIDSEMRKPSSPPDRSESAISINGATAIVYTLGCAPEASVSAIALETAKTIRPTASSMATTGSSVLVSSPLALYWRTTMSVAAGAVAVAIAPRMIDSDTLNPHRHSTISTSAAAMMDWKSVMIITFLPMERMLESLNSPPMEKAMKPSAMVVMMLSLSSAACGTRPSTHGPISRPAIRYPVTLGRRSFFTTRDKTSPATIAMPR